MECRSVSFVRPMPAGTTLTSAVRQLAGNDEEIKRAETELQSARTALETFQTTCSLEGLSKQAHSRRMSAHGIWILCLPPIAGMLIAPKLGGTLGIAAFALGLFGGPALGFYLMGRAAKAEAAEKFTALAPQETALKQRVTQLEARYQTLCAAPGPLVASITQDQHKVVVNGVPLVKRKDRP